VDWEKLQNSPSESSRDYAALAECISADGEVILPINHLHQCYTLSELPGDYPIATSPSGYVNGRPLFDWIKHFDLYPAMRQTGAYRLLIFDGFRSHLIKEFVDYADDHKVISFSLHPHTFHNPQPCDVTFPPFKHYHKQAVECATRTCCTGFNKVQLSAL
jgi:hypothetical protein